MISQDSFVEKMKWLSNVSGQRIMKESSDYIWDEIKHCDAVEVAESIKEIAYNDERVTLANLWKRIQAKQTQRLEREAIMVRQREEEATRKWFADHKGERGECVNNYQCGSCKRVYCDVVSSFCTDKIKDLMKGNIEQEDFHQSLADKFHGIGFERNTELEPF